MIVIEGIDNSGKSTLARALISERLGATFTIQESEGPPKSSTEFNERIRRYLEMKQTVFVRHPITSNPIYDSQRQSTTPIDFTLRRQFFAMKPFFVYCDPLNRGLGDHLVKEGEDPEHIAMLEAKYNDLLMKYRHWALDYAHFIYRIGDDLKRALDIISYAANG